jgi:thiamine pyrophosphokinase
MKALLILDGEDFVDDQLSRLAADSDLVICTDGAAREALKRNVTPHVVIGDLDALSQDEQQGLHARGVEIIRKTSQESNDFEKALKYLMTKGVEYLTIVAVAGGRVDHTLTNFSILSRFAGLFKEIRLAFSGSTGHVLTQRRSFISFYPLSTRLYSLIPLPSADGVVTKGLKYPLTHETLAFGKREGLSNLSDTTSVTVSIESGALLVMEFDAE